MEVEVLRRTGDTSLWLGWWSDVRETEGNTDDTGSLEQASGRKGLLIRGRRERQGVSAMCSKHSSGQWKLGAGVPRVAHIGGLGVSQGLQLVFMTKVGVKALGGVYGEKGRGLVSLSK